ncbi:MAG: response regulator [Planctomycetota bacterium]
MPSPIPPRILIADDHTKLVEALKFRFEKRGFQVHTAHDGYNALATATREPLDLMILDINMPAGDGFSVQERLHKPRGSAGIPVIYITGDKSVRLDEVAEDLGALAVFHKPFQFNELFHAASCIVRDIAA